MLKKTSLAVLGLIANSWAVAGTMGPVCTPDQVTVPCEMKQWDFGAQGLYLKSAFDADYGYDNILGNNYQAIDHDWDGGYRLEGSYHFGTGNDATITWMHYDSGNHQTGFLGNLIRLIGVPFLVPNVLVMDNKFDQVNMVMGQHVDFGRLKNARFYAGLQYANIRVNASNLYTDPLLAALNTTSVNHYHDTDFNGVGPVMGVDFSYDVKDGFSITANSALSLLYGTGRYSDGYIWASGLIAPSQYATKRMIVPSLEAKLGANYAYAVANGVFNIEGGYMSVNYFNALQNSGVGYLGGIRASDYAVYGPYLGAKWVGNV